MVIDKQLYTPISVLLGCGLIGAGLFFGLRERALALPLSPPAARQAALRAATPVAVSAPRDLAAAQQAVEQALDAQRAGVIARCIAPASRGGPASRLHINVSFDANGQQITRGIMPEREDPRWELAGCATDALPGLTIPAQIAPAALDLVWTLP